MYPIAPNRTSAGVFSDAVSQTDQPDAETLKHQIDDANQELERSVRARDTENIRAFFGQAHSEAVLEGLTKGHTALHFAAALDRADAVKVLLEYLPNAIDAKDGRGNTPLLVATKHGHLDTIRVLRAADAAPGVTDEQGWTAFFWAAFLGAVDIIKALLGYEAGAADIKANIEATDKNGNTPIMVAIEENKFDAVALLIELGADVNAKNNAGATPAMLAARNWDLATLRLLHENGADLNQKDKGDNSVLVYATCKQKGQFDREAASATVKLLKDCGADLEMRNYRWDTPLVIAFDRGQAMKSMEGAEVLIEAGANIHDKDNNGETVLMRVGVKKNREAVTLLIDKGVDVDAQDNQGWVALSHACSRNDVVFAEILLSAGASTQVRDNRDRRPIDHWPKTRDMSMADLFDRFVK